MADVRSVLGARVRITASEGSYEGTVHSLDQHSRKLTLTKGNKIIFQRFVQQKKIRYLNANRFLAAGKNDFVSLGF